MKELFNLQRGCDPQVENCCSKATRQGGNQQVVKGDGSLFQLVLQVIRSQVAREVRLGKWAVPVALSKLLNK